MVGSALLVAAAVHQPYNENELKQIAPYDGDTITEVAGGTRQPPLGAVLGAILQHLLGVGDLQQRLVPVFSGIGTLIVMGLLMRKLRLGVPGVFGLWVLATAPLMVRYGAYTRPYMLPLFLMVLFVYAAQRWIDDRRWGWLAVAALAAAALPLARVPEPMVFLAATAGILGLATLRGRFSWWQSGPLVAIVVAAIGVVGYPMYRTLARQSAGFYDPSPAGVASRFVGGVEAMLTGLLPLLAEWLPWWPITLAVIVAAVAVPASRRRLFGWWFFWPLVIAPVAFVVAYHFINSYPLEIRPYRPRMATFFLPAYVLVVVALASTMPAVTSAARRMRSILFVLLAAVLIGQLPMTAHLLRDTEAVDYRQAAEVISEDLPDDAIVLYDAPSRIGMWRQPFSARPHYMVDAPFLSKVGHLTRNAEDVPEQGPVYLLIVDTECGYTVVCDGPTLPWDEEVEGWQVKSRFSRFTLYESTTGASGRQGVIKAAQDFGDALGLEIGYPYPFVAAALLKLEGKPQQGRAVIRDIYAEADPELAGKIRRLAKNANYNAFERNN